MKDVTQIYGTDTMLSLIMTNRTEIYNFSEYSVAFIFNEELIIYPKSELYQNSQWPKCIQYRKDIAIKSLEWTRSRFDNNYIKSKIDSTTHI